MSNGASGKALSAISGTSIVSCCYSSAHLRYSFHALKITLRGHEFQFTVQCDRYITQVCSDTELCTSTAQIMPLMFTKWLCECVVRLIPEQINIPTCLVSVTEYVISIADLESEMKSSWWMWHYLQDSVKWKIDCARQLLQVQVYWFGA